LRSFVSALSQATAAKGGLHALHREKQRLERGMKKINTTGPKPRRYCRRIGFAQREKFVPGWPLCRQYWQIIFASDASTASEPESAKT
jgi:hypothetical protein